MDRSGRRRYFIVGSVILEIVTPLMRTKIENYSKSRGFTSIQDFINSRPLVHILFHLRHRNALCCFDSQNCVNHRVLPLIPKQWDLLYAENPGQSHHYCHCKFTAKPIHLDDLDLNLAALILLNCTSLTPSDEYAIDLLRIFKNNHLSNNTKGCMTETEYRSLWTDLTSYILQLDPSKNDELIRLENRPLDEALCNKYCTSLLEIHERLDEVDAKLQELLDIAKHKVTCSECKRALHVIPGNNLNRYKLGQSIFLLHHQFDIRSILNGEMEGFVTSGVMMDDGRLVLCLPNMCRLLICNTDGSNANSIHLQYPPWCITVVNNSTVAVTSLQSLYIEMYDINNKDKLKSIKQPAICWGGITTINSRLVVHSCDNLYLIDYETGEVVETIMKEEQYAHTYWVPFVYATDERIFYSDWQTNKLCCYSCTDDKYSTTELPSRPIMITSLQDGSLYVVCKDDSVQHVSSDGRHYKTVTTEGLKSARVISYNQKQRKLLRCDLEGHVQVLLEI